MKFFIGLFSIILAFSSCSPKQETSEDHTPQEGLWRGTIALNDSISLPFIFDWNKADSGYVMNLYNGEERIAITDIIAHGDSLRIRFPVFANFLIVKTGKDQMNGYYINPDAEDYRLPFQATAGDSNRFEVKARNCCIINKKWAARFSPEEEDESPAIGYFEQEGNHVTGTFLTETGDYRYLEGVLSGNQLQLSAFDGAHLFYFKATIQSGQTMAGTFYSGRSWAEPWMAYRDDDFTLRNPDSLTYLKEGTTPLEFSFPDVDGKVYSLETGPLADKPVIVQIMGSWCPNCMDETRYLTEIYEQYHPEGLEIVALAFERAKNKEAATQRVKKMIRDLDIRYPVLLAGYTREDKASEALPMLNHVMSYPTTIYLNEDHKVVHIHTGFSGPGTPVYDEFVNENNQRIEMMVKRMSFSAQKD